MNLKGLNDLIDNTIIFLYDNIINCISFISKIYSNYKLIISLSILIIFLKSLWNKRGNYKLKVPVYYFLITLIIGFLVYKADINKLDSFFISYLKSSIIILVLGLVVLANSLLTYKNSTRKIISNYYKFIYFILHTILFSLATINALDFSNLLILLIFILISFNQIVSIENDSKDKRQVDESSDESIIMKEQLFESRLFQLQHIKGYLINSHYDEAFAIAINADWGKGKTSFVNVLIDELKKEIQEEEELILIFIQPMILDTKKKLMEYFFKQLKQALEINGVYTGKTSAYKNYFELVMKMIKNNKFSILSEILGIFKDEPSDFREVKENFENDIRSIADKKIYIIIDDFDRVEKETVYNTLVFIKQIVSFRGCRVIFLMDNNRIERDFISNEYLCKFINKTFDLVEVQFEEIANYFISKKIFLDKNYDDLDIIQKQLSILKGNFIFYIKKIKEEFYELSNNKNNELIQMNEEDKETIKDKKGELEEIKAKIYDFENKLTNPRKIKKLFRETEHLFDNFHQSYKDEESDHLTNNFQRIDANRIIFNISFIKIFFEEEYKEILKMSDIEKAFDKYKGYLIGTILKDLDKFGYLSYEEQLDIELKAKFYNIMLASDKEYKYFIDEINNKYISILEKIDLNNKIEFIDYNQMKDYLDAIERYINHNKAEERFKKVTDGIFQAQEDNKIRFWEVTNLLKHDIISVRLLALNNYYLKRLKELLTSNKIVYDDRGDKNENNNIIKSLKHYLILHFRKDIDTIIKLYNLEKNEYNVMKDISSLEHMNLRAKQVLDILNFDIKFSGSEVDKLRGWVRYINKDIKVRYKGKKFINIDYHIGETELFVECFELVDDVLNLINNIDIKINYDDEIYTSDIDGISKIIHEFYNRIIHAQGYKNNGSYNYFMRIITKVNKSSKNHYIDKEIIQKMNELYKKLNNNLSQSYKWKKSWFNAGISMAEIDINQKRLSKIKVLYEALYKIIDKKS
ncbi:KAP-like P-loop domain-containing protein [Orenia metallireducens]|uniref:KAP family P-loop domain-containing protein n=1 Tax=Orenia metallireducens TaxID=1413210 RepID=A0A285IIB9_9FIRM|nr:P-loop NTPase fold protein [Orenia metallireducens]PRX18489.1 KAP-like P-loop domain-containing protein [Orenia metallireducens]SNY46691.1 KAP family P-loop domain-containing protein [Orenia metallireducens]